MSDDLRYGIIKYNKKEKRLLLLIVIEQWYMIQELVSLI